MDLKECYQKLGGDYDSVVGRLRREQLVKKFLLKFLDDKSYSLFVSSMEHQDYAEALRAVHTLKGICQNLSFTQLFDSSNQVTKALKENDVDLAVRLSPQLSKDFEQTIQAINQYKSSVEG